MAIKTNKKEGSDRIALLADILTRLAYSDTSFGISELGRELSKNKMYILSIIIISGINRMGIEGPGFSKI